MKLHFILGVALSCILLASQSATAQTLNAARISFHTTSDDKDGDTQVRDSLIFGGVEAAKLECCSANAAGDKFENGSDASRDMQILQHPTKAQAHTGILRLGSSAHGNDKWVFVPTLHLEYSDGTAEDIPFKEQTLNSRGSHETHVDLTLQR